MHSFLRALGIVTIAMIVSVVILAVLISATNTVTIIESVPSDFLPEYQTVALFSNVSEETLRKFETLFPVLGDITPDETKIIALLYIDNEFLVAEFSEAGAKSSKGSTFGRFSVSASDPRTEALLKTSTPRLSSSLPYKELAQEESWVFLDLSVLPPPQTLSEKFLVALIPDGSTHAALSFEDDRIVISLIGGHPIPSNGLSPLITSTFSGSMITLRSANASRAWGKLINGLKDGERSFLEGSIGRLVEDKWGSSVSFAYSVLPMLQRPTTIHLGKNASGGIVFAIEGIDENTSALSDNIERLFTGFSSAVPNTKVTKRTFDSRFSATDIRIDEGAIREDAIQYKNWGIKISRAPDGREFATATLGSTFVLANDSAALEQILKQNAAITPPTIPSLTRTTRLADGVLSFDEASLLLRELFPALKQESLPSLLSHLSGKLLWSVEQNGFVTTLVIE
ncbi:MAG: hypothetical protein ABIA92_00035 [Patescibacteria group bacterium]